MLNCHSRDLLPALASAVSALHAHGAALPVRVVVRNLLRHAHNSDLLPAWAGAVWPVPHAGRAAWQPAALPHDASLHARWHHWRRRHFDRHWHGREYKLGVLWTASVVLFCVLARRIVDSATRGYVDVDDGAPETPGTASKRPGGQRLDAV